ncbi:hypothetical protein ACLB2K_011748 [Fragaria x ananassa]
MQRSLYSHATDAEIRPLNEEKAVQAAVDLIGEFFVFTVAVVRLLIRFSGSSEIVNKLVILHVFRELEKLAKGQGSVVFSILSVFSIYGGSFLPMKGKLL